MATSTGTFPSRHCPPTTTLTSYGDDNGDTYALLEHATSAFA